MTGRYCAYLRKSRADLEAEARGEGDTLARHRGELLRASARIGLQIEAFYEEVLSGESIAARPVMRRLLSEVERGLWAGVFVVEVERLARGDTIDQGVVARAFQCTHTRILTPAKIYDPDNEFDEEYFEFGLFMSRREYKAINRRLQRGRVASVNEGKYVGNVPPYGYERVKLEGQKGWTLRPHPREAEVVRGIFDLYTGVGGGDGARLGSTRIADRLNGLHIPSRSGGEWTPATIHGILHNPVYTGMVRWNGRPQVKNIEGGRVVKSRPRNKDALLAPGLHPPLISAGQWREAQRLPREHPAPPGPRRLKNRLAGLVVCGLCGRPMQRRPNKAGVPDWLICTNPRCQNVGSELAAVEARLLEALRGWLGPSPIAPRRDARADGARPLREQGARRLREELDALAGQRDAAHDLLEQGVYTPDVFTARVETLAARETGLRRELGRFEQSAAKSPERAAPPAAPDEPPALLDAYAQARDAAAANRLLKAVVERVAYTKPAGGRWDEAARDGFELEIVVKLPEGG